MTFIDILSDEIIKIFFDKGLLALLVAVVVFFLNRQLEKNKNDNSRILQLENQQRALENNILLDKRLRKLGYLEKQLSEFYWPIYLRLEKDSVLWERVPNFFSTNVLPVETNDFLEREVLLKNHEDVMKIIESKYYLAESDEKLHEEILKYVRHVTVYSAIRKVPTLNERNPVDFNEPFPSKFISLFTAKKDEIQNRYNNLLDEVKK